MVTIYALKDPDTNDVRYIGQTKEPDSRRHVHSSCVTSKHKMNPDYKAWMKDLRERSAKPVFVVLEEVDESQADSTEDKYIYQCIRDGNGSLTNRRNSGGGKLPTLEDLKRWDEWDRERKINADIYLLERSIRDKAGDDWRNAMLEELMDLCVERCHLDKEGSYRLWLLKIWHKRELYTAQRWHEFWAPKQTR
jgi:hypothetical protein